MTNGRNTDYRVILNHIIRASFLRDMIDSVSLVDLEKEEVQGVFRISRHDKIFQEHYPGQNIYPGINIIQGLVWCCAILGATVKTVNGELDDGLSIDHIKHFMNAYEDDHQATIRIRLRDTVQGDNTLHYHVRTHSEGYRCRALIENRCVADGTIIIPGMAF